MKRALFVIMILAAALGGTWYWRHRHEPEAKPGDKTAEKTAEEKPEASRIKHDDKGHVVILMDDETQGKVGLIVAKPAAAQVSPEIKGYGRVLDPAALTALLTELASAQAAHTASSNDFVRVKTLAPQGNATERDLQKAEATARHDQLAVQSALDRLVWSWSKGVAEQNDLPGFVQALTSLQAALVRIDLPAGETLKGPPKGARVATLNGAATEAEYLGAAPLVDPQTLGRGSIFLIKTNAIRLLAGEPIVGFIQVPGEPLTGVLIPNEAVVRAEGAGWVYLLNSGGASFTRLPITLDHPMDAGWFITQGMTTNDHVVIAGAQVLLSEELKASIASD